MWISVGDAELVQMQNLRGVVSPCLPSSSISLALLLLSSVIVHPSAPLSLEQSTFPPSVADEKVVNHFVLN